MPPDSAATAPKRGALQARLEMTRSWNSGVVFGGTLLGAALVQGGFPREFWVWMAALGASLITGAGNILNDVYDLEIDRVNKPDRVLPSGRMTPERARRESWALFAAGIVLSAVNPWTLFLAVINSILLAYYARASKRMLGTANITVAYLVASVFPFGALAGLGPGFPDARMIRDPEMGIVTLCAFLVGLSLEIVKDIEDIPGDSQMGAKTLPLAYGERAARWMAISTTLAAVALSPFAGRGLHWAYYPVVAAADFSFLASHTRPPREGRKAISLGMGLVCLALLLGVLLR